MVAAGASAASSIEGLGMRLRVRGSSVSRKPVSRKSPASPMRQEMPSVGSAIENTTLQPPLWREKEAIGALVESVGGVGLRGAITGGMAAATCWGGAEGFAASACPFAEPFKKTLSTIWSV